MPAMRRRLKASLIWLLRVWLACATYNTEGTWLPSTTASASPSTGGPSRMMNCTPSACSKSISSPNLGPVSKSTGLGGMGPAVMTCRLGTSVTWGKVPAVLWPDKKFDRPLVLPKSRYLWMVGLRMSASISTVLRPSCAKLMASATAVVDLPSFLAVLVTTRRRGAPSEVENCSAVRTER